jgi:hypothetical protein
MPLKKSALLAISLATCLVAQADLLQLSSWDDYTKADSDPNAVANPNDNTDFSSADGTCPSLNSDGLPNPNDNRKDYHAPEPAEEGNCH